MPNLPVVANDDDVREFRRIRAWQTKTSLFPQTAEPRGGAWHRAIKLLDRSGRLGRLARALRVAFRGTKRSGVAIARRDGVGVGRQFYQLFAATLRTGICNEDFYLHSTHQPQHWKSHGRIFTSDAHSVPAQLWLGRHTRAAELECLQDKGLFIARCRESGLPTIEAIGDFVNGNSREVILPAKDLVSKPRDLHSGIGVQMWRYDTGDGFYVNAATDTRLAPFDLVAHLANSSKTRPILLQERVENHPLLNSITNGALATLRLVTCVAPDGSIEFLPPVVRLPTGLSVVDGFHQRGLAAPIDLATGVVSGAAAQMDHVFGLNWVDRHPDTDEEIRGRQIPLWGEVKDLALRAHHNFQSVPFIGWDIALSPTGPILVEGNSPFGTDVIVVPHRITLSETQFIPYYNYHWRKAKEAENGAIECS